MEKETQRDVCVLSGGLAYIAALITHMVLRGSQESLLRGCVANGKQDFVHFSS